MVSLSMSCHEAHGLEPLIILYKLLFPLPHPEVSHVVYWGPWVHSSHLVIEVSHVVYWGPWGSPQQSSGLCLSAYNYTSHRVVCP